MRKTKIICTLGQSTKDVEVIKQLILAGMNVARINFSHGTHEENQEYIDNLKTAREELNVPIALMLDTKGPEIRICRFENGSAELHEGDTFILTTDDIIGNNERVSINYKGLINDVRIGNRILLDDGIIELIIKDINPTEIICEVKNGGILSNQKSSNVPEAEINLPALTQKDVDDIKFGILNGFDYIAASFVRKADDVLLIRSVLKENGGENINIIAKIENPQGVNNIDEILKVSDGIMVARGDLGVEIPIEDVPIVQKQLIEKSYKAGKPVITATQMLDSMIRNPRPTRAEVTDIANAIYDGTSAIMLSGETAVGKHPIESLETMGRIAQRAEQSIDYKKRLTRHVFDMDINITNAISHATCTTAHDLGAKAIITVTTSGSTARMVSKFRPACPIIATTPNDRVQRQLCLSWGVIPLIAKLEAETIEIFEHAVEIAKKNQLIQKDDLVVITGGIPSGIAGTTNALKVHVIE